MKKEFTHITQAGYSLQVTVYGVDLPPSTPNLLYIHGFKGFKDWGFAPPTAEFFHQQGYRYTAFNFSHNGIGTDPLSFTEMEKFKNNTFSLEVQETLEMIDAIREGTFFQVDQNAPLGIIGHSRGGGIGLLAASTSKRVDAICSWNAVSTFERYDEAALYNWKAKGYSEVINSRTGQVFQMGMPLLQDLLTHKSRFLNIQKAVKRMEKPLCIVQGEADLAVIPQNAYDIYDWSDQNISTLHMIPEAGHTFNAKHPFEGTPPQLETAWNHTLNFFRSNLKSATA